MANMFKVIKSEPSKSRKLPFLPRVGLVVDAFGLQFVFKGVPLAETFLSARERGLTLANLRKAAEDQLAEVTFPKVLGRLAMVKNLAKTKEEKTPVKKSAPKAAATPKKKAEKVAKTVESTPETV